MLEKVRVDYRESEDSVEERLVARALREARLVGVVGPSGRYEDVYEGRKPRGLGENRCRDESRHGTQECVRHELQATFSRKQSYRLEPVVVQPPRPGGLYLFPRY